MTNMLLGEAIRRRPIAHHPDVLTEAREAVWRYLAEGVFDPYILKCVFMAGGGGSGKGFVSNVMFGTMKDMATTSFGVKSLNSDDILASLAKGMGGREPLDLKTQLGSEKGQALRGVAKRLVGARKELFLRGRLGIIIDGTADDSHKIARIKAEMESLGYDCCMVFVNTTLDVALKRNQMRSRVVPEKFVREAHANVQKAVPKFRSMFGKRFAEVDNSEAVSARQVVTELTPRLHRIALKFLSEPLKNPIGWKWLREQTEGMPREMLSKVTWIGKKRGR